MASAILSIPAPQAGAPATATPSTKVGGTTITPYKWVVGWILFIAFLALIVQSDTGYRAVYYGLILILIVLWVSQYKGIAQALLPVGFQPEDYVPASQGSTA